MKESKSLNSTSRALQHFVDAQQAVYAQVLRELRAGKKQSHWMWFIFPQLAGLGHSPTARRFAITDRAHAMNYLAHPLLGARLRECAGLVNLHSASTVADIFGYPDDLKFHSCMTLFGDVMPDEAQFSRALDIFFAGVPDRATLRLLDSNRGSAAHA